MTTNPNIRASIPAHGRPVVVSLLGSVTSVVVLLIVYYAAPLDRPLDSWTWIRFVAGLLAYAGLIVWQVRAIAGSGFPRLRAVQAMATGFPVLLVLYASWYSVIAHQRPESFSEALSRTDALYFAVTVFATVGFGDITPRTELARVLTMTQMLVGLVAIGLVAKILLGAVGMAAGRDGAAGPRPDRDH
ncbi:MAG: potassium channel family protein [Pseudonocardia sp.]|nr:potassium channel family protein [Pseudonocardia sp.]